jgi:DNA-binding transcriptional regulator YdaS (Cro superfamily)
MNAIERAIKAAGGPTALAKSMGFPYPSTVTNWKRAGTIPPEHCIAVERATAGKVTRYDLRPDVFGPAPKIAAPKKRRAA